MLRTSRTREMRCCKSTWGFWGYCWAHPWGAGCFMEQCRDSTKSKVAVLTGHRVEENIVCTLSIMLSLISWRCAVLAYHSLKPTLRCFSIAYVTRTKIMSRVLVRTYSLLNLKLSTAWDSQFCLQYLSAQRAHQCEAKVSSNLLPLMLCSPVWAAGTSWGIPLHLLTVQ